MTLLPHAGVHPDTAKITVHLDKGDYNVLNAPGLLRHVGNELRRQSDTVKVAVITDTNVGPAHLPALRASLEEFDFEVIDCTIAAGESSKTLAGLTPIYDRLLAARIDRETFVIGLGGGVVTDMAGFVAATVLRGVPLVQIPTSLLAMVDASVGGKTGVNHAAGKNLIGAFHQPALVLIDPAVLATLPDAELRGGLAECVKHDVIRDAEHFAEMERSVGRALSRDVDHLADLIAHNVRIKAAVVAADPFERGERAHLNYGHTFGHAVERVGDFAHSHGEAVSLGMVAAGRLAVMLGLFDNGERRRVEALLTQIGLPTGGLTLDADAVVDAMAGDKKAVGGRVRLVLPERIGRVVIRDDVPRAAMREAVASLRDFAAV